jgi:hypothetical protein
MAYRLKVMLFFSRSIYRSNQIFRSLQLPVQILKRVAEIILLFGYQRCIPESVNGSHEASHNRCLAFDRSG